MRTRFVPFPSMPISLLECSQRRVGVVDQLFEVIRRIEGRQRLACMDLVDRSFRSRDGWYSRRPGDIRVGSTMGQRRSGRTRCKDSEENPQRCHGALRRPLRK